MAAIQRLCATLAKNMWMRIKEFANCFLGKTAWDSSQLAIWSEIVVAEIGMASSSRDSTVFTKTISLYKQNGTYFNKKENGVLDKFTAMMKKEWEIVNPNK